MTDTPLLADQVRNAKSHAERALLLLTAPYLTLFTAAGPLATACREAAFPIGADYLDAEVARLCAVRSGTGTVPPRHVARVEGLSMMLRRFANDADETLIAMMGAHDAKAGRAPSADLAQVPAYREAWEAANRAETA